LQNIDAYVAPGGTFLNPLQDDEDANWSARKSLLEAYRDVVEVMNARGIYDEEPPGFGQPPPDTENKKSSLYDDTSPNPIARCKKQAG